MRSRSTDGPERVLAGEHEVELLDVVLAHACVPVEALGAPRRHSGEGGGRDQPVAAECRAGQRMRPAAGDAPRREPLELERVGDRLDVRNGGEDRAAAVARRAAVAGPVEADQADTGRRPGAVEDAGARRPVVDEHGETTRVTCLVQLEGPPVGGLDDRCHRDSFSGFRRGSDGGRRGSATARGSTATRR